MSPAQVENMAGGFNREKRGVLIGFWDEEALPAEVQEVRAC